MFKLQVLLEQFHQLRLDGPKLSHALQGLLQEFPELQVAMEPYGAYAHTASDLSKQLALIIRQNLRYMIMVVQL